MTDLQNKNELNYYEESDLTLYDGKLVPKEADDYLKEINTEILKIKNDRIFSYLFNENKIENIEWAVSKILDCDIEKVRNKVIVKNNKLAKHYISEKQKYVDLLVETYKKNSCLIELNNNFNGNYKRNLLYAFSILLSKYIIGKKSEYKDVNRIILVNLNWHNTKKSKKEKEIEENIIYYDVNKEDYLIKAINVNLDKFEDISYNNVVNSNKFYKLLTIGKGKELKDIGNKEKELKGYIEELSKISEDITFRKDYMDDEMSEYIEKLEAINDKKIAEEKSFNAGVKEGIMQNKKDMVTNFYNNGASLDLIKKSTGMNEEEIKEIIKENRKNLE